MEKMLNLKCKICGCEYEKPENFKIWNAKRTNVFFRWSLEFCNKCRWEKEIKALNRLPEIIKILAN